MFIYLFRQQIVIKTSSVEYHGLPFFYDLQVKMFKFSYYSSYFRFKMVERKKTILAQVLWTISLVIFGGSVCCLENYEFYIYLEWLFLIINYRRGWVIL